MERRAVDLGGTILEAVVEGTGPVTVVFENGIATPLEEWDAVVPRVAERARVVRYDHRDAAPHGAVAPRSIADVLGDLERLLTALAAQPPYVFVGHSWGGVVARLFTHDHPSQVAGLVLVDATHEVIGDRTIAIVPAIYSVTLALARMRFVRRALVRQFCPPGSSAAYRARIEGRLNDPVRWPIGLRTARAESAALPAAIERLRRDCPNLPPLPAHVLTAGGVSSAPARRVRAAWKAATDRAASARYTEIPAATHHLPIDQPDAVADAILGVLDATNPAARRDDRSR